MKKYGIRRSVLATVYAAGLATGAGLPQAAWAQEKVNIAVYPGQTFHMNVYVADAKGFYKQAGLDPTFITVNTGPLMNSMLASGAVDITFQPPTNIAVSREQGLDQVMIAGNMSMPYVVIGKKGLKLPNKGKYPGVMGDFKGMNWGVTGRGSDSEMFMRAMATDAKLDPDKDLTFIGVGLSPTALPALKAGRVDTIITLSPGPAVATALGLGEVLVDLRKGEGPANFKGVMYQGVTMLRQTAVSRPKVVEGLVTAHTKAYCWLRDPNNFDELLSILKTKLAVGELTPDQFAQTVRDEIPIMRVTFPPEDFAVYNEMMLRLKTIKAAISPEDVRWKSVPVVEPKC